MSPFSPSIDNTPELLHPVNKPRTTSFSPDFEVEQAYDPLVSIIQITQAKSKPTEPPTVNDPKVPTTFLSLPREIRQTILRQAYRRYHFAESIFDAHDSDIMVDRTTRKQNKLGNNKRYRMEKQANADLAGKKRILHSAFRGDMGYVQEKLVAELDRVMKECVGGGRDLGIVGYRLLAESNIILAFEVGTVDVEYVQKQIVDELDRCYRECNGGRRLLRWC